MNTMKTIAKPRLHYLDHLKVGLTMLVIAHHAGQPYGGSGGFWFFKSDQTINLGPFFAVNAAFFMSLFFLISGYFLPQSLDRKGVGRFLKDRLQRIGIPLAAGFLLLIPAMMYAYYVNFRPYGTISYWSYLRDVFFAFGKPKPADWSGPSWPDVQFGHLWFLEHLLFYAVIYGLLRLVMRNRRPLRLREPRLISIGGLAVLVALLTFIVRIEYPIDKWVGFLGIIQTEFAHVPQYASFFLLGILAYRNDWLTKLSAPIGRTCLGTGLFLAGLYYMGSYLYGFSFFRGGGLNAGSLFYSFYDTVMCFGLCIGLIYVGREHLNTSHALGRELAANAFAVYIIHVPVVVLLQYALVNMAWPVFVKFLIVSLAGTAGSFLLSWGVLRRIPFVKDIL
ncbi:acyltransferase family protein [Paenibacillus aestuarii]|uniref:Acyltransferase family protein n=1 Tax=Paenibacillus aestuarii TaxID=516965 RepID=A0ABW0K7D9_9BACL|nr:acyltransferase family protein [Paenibacillus aestuarii]